MNMTGVIIANATLDDLQRINVDTAYLVGQGFDDASSMSGYISGAQACIREACPCAVYVHCAAHCLGLTISRSFSIPSIRNCQGIVQETALFSTALLNEITFMQAIADDDVDSNRRRLRNLCKTRGWND